MYIAVAAYSSLPYLDGWIEADPVSHPGDPPLPEWLWEQHNEHRLVIPKLFLLADLRLFRATQVFLLASIFVMQFLHLTLLSWSMRALGGWRGDQWRTGAGIAAFCLFCPSQWFNFVLGLQINFVLLGLFVTLSFIGLLLAWIHPQTGRYVPLSIAAALGATYSLANGNLIWPLLVAAAVLLGLRRSAVMSLAVTGAISTALYFYDYAARTAATNIRSLGAEFPARLFEFAAVYLGSPWVHANNVIAAIFGIAGAGAACFFAARFPSYLGTRKAFRVQMVLTAVFCIGTSLVTSLGRLSLGVSYALTSRYQTFALLFWCCLGLRVLGAGWPVRIAPRALLAGQICVLAVMFRGAFLAESPIREARSHAFQLNTAATALLAGVHDRKQLSYTGVTLNYLVSQARYLQDDQLSIYSGDDYSRLGKPLDEVFRMVSPEECAGALESSESVGDDAAELPALRVTGWAWDVKHGRPPASIVAATDGVIIGLGAMGDWRPTDRVRRPWATSHYVGYTGYVQARASGSVEIYAIAAGNPATACLVATAR